jgi:DNA-3-methyladenine glycosylase
MLYTRRNILDTDFFTQPTLAVAEELLGKYLIRNIKGQERAFQITDVEAYLDEKDQASHARFGRTNRNSVMFAKGGSLYVYLIYGIHHMLNVTAEDEGKAGAILIRGVGDVRGPGKVTKMLNVNKKLHEKKVHPDTGLWFEDWSTPIPKENIQKVPRVGIDYAGEWKDKPYRFVLV